MRLIDSHAHLASLQTDLTLALHRAFESGCVAIVNIATEPEELKRLLSLEASPLKIFHAAATTPHDVEKFGERDFDFFKNHVDKLAAIGETGLDYHYEHSPRQLQKHFLRKYLQLAKENDLPVIFHCREAFEDLFRIVDEEKYMGKALLHCFTGTKEEALQCIKRGWFISFSGIVTFKKSDALRECAKVVPLEQMLIETDAPYLAPQSQRGTPNEPAFLIETARCLANLFGISAEEFAERTAKNAASFFNFLL